MQSEKKTMSEDEFSQLEKGIVWTVVDFATNIPVTVYSDSLGVKAPEAMYRSAMWSEYSRLIGEEYLLNANRSTLDIALPTGVFNYSSSVSVKAGLCNRILLEEEAQENGEVVALPRFKPLNEPLGSVIRSRRSIRRMSGKEISLQDLATILFYANGVSGKFDFDAEGNLPQSETLGGKYESTVRTAPSGGGLYPVYLYCAALNIKGLPKGIYRYQPLTHTLLAVKPFDEKDLEEFYRLSNWGVNIDAPKINIVVYYVYSLFENSRKYADRAMQFAYIETGEIAENIYLACTALNFAVTDIGGYDKKMTEDFLGVDGLTKHLLHLTLIGSIS